jgi:hypothetical protein
MGKSVCKKRGYHSWMRNQDGDEWCDDCGKFVPLQIRQLKGPEWMTFVRFEANDGRTRFSILDVDYLKLRILAAPRWMHVFIPIFKIRTSVRRIYWRSAWRVVMGATKFGWLHPIEGERLTFRTLLAWRKRLRE